MAHAAHTLLVILAPAATALAGEGPAVEFHRLGSGLAHGVSDDGSTVVGENSQGAFAWTREGTIGLGGIAGIAANMDGSLITGDVTDSAGNSAGRWAAGNWTAFGAMGSSGCDASLSSAYDISSNGARCVGLGWSGCSASAFLWRSDTGMVALPQDGPNSSRADTISGDGMVIGGWDEASNGSRRAAAWHQDANTGEWDETILLQGLPGNTAGYGEVNGSNSDGSILLGSSNGSSIASDGAFVYRQGSGVEVLGMVPQDASPATAGALDASEDGNIIVGFQREGFGGAQQFKATIWTPDTGLMLLKTYLNDLGANIPAAFTLAAGMSISDDGRVFCGWGYEGLFFAQEAWIVTIDGGADCPGDFDNDGFVGGGDLGFLLAAWGTSNPEFDLDGNGAINGGDLGLFLSFWGICS